MSDDWMAGLIKYSAGNVDPRRATNVYLYLSEHPEMKGVWGKGPPECTAKGAWIKAKPPWGEFTGERPARADDYYQAHMWLEIHGLTPSRTMVRDAIQAIVQNNC